MSIVKNRTYFYIFSGVLVVFCFLSIFTKGFNVGLDFTGGSALEVAYEGGRPATEDVKETLVGAGVKDIVVRPFGDDGFILSTQSIDPATHELIKTTLTSDATERGLVVTTQNPHIIGSTIGAELRQKAWIAVVLVVVGIVLFVAYAFRHVVEGERNVPSWVYAIVTVITLVHDVIVPAGLVSFLGIQVDSLFIIAILSILGLSVNDTIVVFDRVRENVKNKVSRKFDEVVSASLKQTIVRSINTSATIIFVLVVLYLMGPETTKDFSFVLAVGIFFGTYSSVFLASPVLVDIEKWYMEKQKREKGKV